MVLRTSEESGAKQRKRVEGLSKRPGGAVQIRDLEPSPARVSNVDRRVTGLRTAVDRGRPLHRLHGNYRSVLMAGV